MVTRIADQVKSGHTLISDGAWGTFLHQKGLGVGECPERWNVERPDDVLAVAAGYIRSGADMIETNSFGGSRFKLASYGLEDRVTELNRAAAAISREAAGEDKIVLGSIGPTGKLLMMGEVTDEELYDAFREQAVALEAGGADAIIVETMSDLGEASAAVRAASEHTDCEIICTMSFEADGAGNYFTMMGVTPSQMVKTIAALGVDIIGANCGKDMRDMVGITEEIRAAAPDLPILIHANAGSPVYKDGQTIFPETPEQMAAFVPELVEAGANIIGGCCGTTPEHIRQIAAKIQKPT